MREFHFISVKAEKKRIPGSRGFGALTVMRGRIEKKRQVPIWSNSPTCHKEI